MTLPPDGKFKAGDRVRIGSWEGVLPEKDRYGFFVIEAGSNGHIFDSDGCSWGASCFGPLMQLIERPKRKVKRMVALFKYQNIRCWEFDPKEHPSSNFRTVWQGEIEVDDD